MLPIVKRSEWCRYYRHFISTLNDRIAPYTLFVLTILCQLKLDVMEISQKNNIFTNKQLCRAISCTLLFCRYIYIYWVFSECLYILSVCTLIHFQLSIWRQLILWPILYLSTIFVSSKVITVVWYIYNTAYACYTLVVHRPLTTVLRRLLFFAILSRSCNL